ncbi:MAG: hypothetical protein HONBIEJF_01693 [Fimbriimonadaceae bacterium]|nr:hypothetical protein [Fimbriimonadaceae bacterium]
MSSGGKVALFLVKWIVVPVGFLLVGFFLIGPRIGAPVKPSFADASKGGQTASNATTSAATDEGGRKRNEPVVEISASELTQEDRDRLRRENAPRVAPYDPSTPRRSSTRRKSEEPAPPPEEETMLPEEPIDEGGSAGGAGLTGGDEGGTTDTTGGETGGDTGTTDGGGGNPTVDGVR